jgi:hypothetical protein
MLLYLGFHSRDRSDGDKLGSWTLDHKLQTNPSGVYFSIRLLSACWSVLEKCLTRADIVRDGLITSVEFAQLGRALQFTPVMVSHPKILAAVLFASMLATPSAGRTRAAIRQTIQTSMR